jgi:hypothetical protein
MYWELLIKHYRAYLVATGKEALHTWLLPAKKHCIPGCYRRKSTAYLVATGKMHCITGCYRQKSTANQVVIDKEALHTWLLLATLSWAHSREWQTAPDTTSSKEKENAVQHIRFICLTKFSPPCVPVGALLLKLKQNAVQCRKSDGISGLEKPSCI